MTLHFRKITSWILLLVLLVSMVLPAAAAENRGNVTILFTHDLHSHLLPSDDVEGGEYGGYARLMTVINQQKALYPNAILVDAGDFSMGSLFQTAYPTSAIELRMMGAMGYNVTTFGNHEFDYLPSGLVAMLRAAVGSGDALPAIVDANYLPPVKGSGDYTSDSEAVWAALENYGVKDYQILERGGIYYVLFSLFGYDSDDCAPNSGMILEDPAVAAQRVVDAATAECLETYGVAPIVVALSHSGTSGGQGEDYDLAGAVTGIDLIVYIVAQLIMALGMGIYSTVSWAMMGDAIDYNEWKTGNREEGIVYSLHSFFRKLAQGVGPALALTIMQGMGYVNNAVDPETGAEIIDVTLLSWDFAVELRSLVAILYLVAAVMLFIGLGLIYNLDKKTMGKMNTELAARKAK